MEYFCAAKPQSRESSRPTEPPRQPLTEPYVTLSRHTALVIPVDGNLSTTTVQRLLNPTLRLLFQSLLNNAAPSLHCHYNNFNTTTSNSATVCCIDTLTLRGHRFRLLSEHQHDSFPSSSQKPDKRSRLLYAGCHRVSKQFSSRFLSAVVRTTDFDNS